MKNFAIHWLAYLFAASLATVSAAEDRVAHSSPDGSVTLRNIGDTAAADHHFQIISRSGAVLWASDKDPKLQSGSFAENIAWSSDSRYVAFSVRTSGPYVRDSFVFSVGSKQLIRVPTEDDDHQTRPIRWHDNRTLIVQTTAPFGGKAGTDKESASYRYRRTIRISGNPVQFETLYTSPRTHPQP